MSSSSPNMDEIPPPPSVENEVVEAPLHDTRNEESTATADAIQHLAHMTQPPRQYLIDRSNGVSKTRHPHTDEELGRPGCPMAWPPPCVKWCPSVLEQNQCCENYGKIGWWHEDNITARTWLMRVSLVSHAIGLVLSILACLALSTDASVLDTFNFSSGTVTGTVNGTNIQEVLFRVGIRSIYVSDYYFGERSYDMDELCAGTTMGIPLTSVQDCHSCKDASSGLVATVVLGVLTYIPTIASNFNRGYYNYDVNCQKVFGTVVALFNMILSLYTWQGYKNKCVDSFYEGQVQIPVFVPGENQTLDETMPPLTEMMNYTYAQELETGQIPDLLKLFPGVNETMFDGQARLAYADLNFDWVPGTALVFVVMATFLKILDIIDHFLIPTPRITRDRQEQLEYEALYGQCKSKNDSGKATQTNTHTNLHDNKGGGHSDA